MSRTHARGGRFYGLLETLPVLALLRLGTCEESDNAQLRGGEHEKASGQLDAVLDWTTSTDKQQRRPTSAAAKRGSEASASSRVLGLFA